MRTAAFFLGLHLGLALAAVAGPPRIDNADLRSDLLATELTARVESWSTTSEEVSWLGWHVPMVERDQVLCCWSGGEPRRQIQSCALEGSHRHFVFSSRNVDPRMGGENLVILLRSSGGDLDEIRVYSDGCSLDAGGRSVTWLEGVEPERSVDLLSRLTLSRSDLRDEALMALALHRTPLAVERLAEIARADTDTDLRGEALFWLAHTGAPSAAGIILEALAEDRSSEVQEEAIFALSQLPDGEGMPWLLEILQDSSRPAEVREEAFFWYVQSGDDEALDLIAEILAN